MEGPALAAPRPGGQLAVHGPRGPARAPGSAWGVWRFAGEGPVELSAGLGARYMSWFRDGDAPRVPSLTLFDELLAYDMPRWRLALNGSNPADKTYVSTCLRRGDCWRAPERDGDRHLPLLSGRGGRTAPTCP